MKTNSLWSLAKKYQGNSICACIGSEFMFWQSNFMSKPVSTWFYEVFLSAIKFLLLIVSWALFYIFLSFFILKPFAIQGKVIK